jgi:hypothetical protein
VGHAERFGALFVLIGSANFDAPRFGRRTAIVNRLAMVRLGRGRNGSLFILGLQTHVVRIAGDDLVEEDLVAEVADAQEPLAPAIDGLAGLFFGKRREIGRGFHGRSVQRLAVAGYQSD